MKLVVVDYCLFYPSTWFANNNSPIIHPSESQISFAVADVLLPWLIFQQKLDVLSADCVSPQCPIDARKVLSENVVVIGGTAMLPGFLHRLLAEIRLLVEKPKYSGVLASKSFRIHAPPAKPNCTAWLGGQRGGGVRGLNWQKNFFKYHPPTISFSNTHIVLE